MAYLPKKGTLTKESKKNRPNQEEARLKYNDRVLGRKNLTYFNRANGTHIIISA